MKSAVIALIGCSAVLLGVGLAVRMRHPVLSEPERPTIGGPFSLVNETGHEVSDRSFRGRWMLIYFGYTHCPDACPTTLSDMAAALDKLPAIDRAKVAPLFITVDPERDTPTVIGNYAHAFGPAFVGLSGSRAQVEKAETAYRVYAAKHPLKDGDYAMDHSSVVYVMGPDGMFAGVIGDGATPAEIAERLRGLGV